ncbi:sigma-70 family RNA polymerase sigma factor [Adhaeretor mobilis]|uniref:RNA polymerase sigma factor CnrH n=1 Tax=Adhaeretor mobilis TaxID=1930276 RepID=A0A517N1A8_9BACT|nr:sigma-70 family RNA polymerase sigma factor [Adhaeretor mobilis]QDT00921.1 RNA polymerase sigma factor CnrH [Adhaeretor mobilis]
MTLAETQGAFARLIARHERDVQSYIFASVSRWADADDIWQETIVRLWEEFDKYEMGTNFSAWAIRVAYYEILTWRKRQSRSHLVFDQALVDVIASEQQQFYSEESRSRLLALEQCLESLDTEKREVLSWFYSRAMRVEQIASVRSSTSDAIYKVLQRTRQSLRLCIQKRLDGKAHT